MEQQRDQNNMKLKKQNSNVNKIRRKYVKVKKMGNKWNTYLEVGNQGFTVVENTTLRRARWFGEMLAIALEKMIEMEKK